MCFEFPKIISKFFAVYPGYECDKSASNIYYNFIFNIIIYIVKNWD